MRSRRLVLVIAVAIVSATSLSVALGQRQQEGASPTAQRSFEDTLRGRTVELNSPLYTVLSVLRRGASPAPHGISVLSPDKGAFYRFLGIGPFLDLSDDDTNRLMDKIAAKKRGRRSPVPPAVDV